MAVVDIKSVYITNLTGTFNLLQSDMSMQHMHNQVIGTECPVPTAQLYFKMAPYRIAIMNENIGKFGYDSM